MASAIVSANLKTSLTGLILPVSSITEELRFKWMSDGMELHYSALSLVYPRFHPEMPLKRSI